MIVTSAANILTKELLENLRPRSIIAIGMLWDSPDHIMISGTLNRLYWVAQRGEIYDWCIYYQSPWEGDLAWNIKQVISRGDKIKCLESVSKLIKFDEEAKRLYRI